MMMALLEMKKVLGIQIYLYIKCPLYAFLHINVRIIIHFAHGFYAQKQTLTKTATELDRYCLVLN